MKKISELWIYPIKSLPGIKIHQSKVFDKGFQYDRRWMLIDRSRHFISQRTHPKLALLHLEIISNQLIISQGTTTHAIPMVPPSPGSPILVKIWDDEVKAHAFDQTADDWFSSFLQEPCKLVFFPEENSRPADPAFGPNHEVSFADAFPYLLVMQSSLDDLNARLKNPVSVKRFRPNIVIQGGIPLEEDRYETIKIGKVRFKAVKPCSRCQVPSINPQTGILEKEPLKTLSLYRKKNRQIYFGMNLVALDPGEIKTGDEVTLMGNL